MKILDGKKVAGNLNEFAKCWIEDITQKSGCINLVVIQVGYNSASSTYIRNKQKACDYCGITSTTYYFGDNTNQEELEDFIEELNDDDTVTGILVQLPLPEHLDEWSILNKINPKKDIDGFTMPNVAKLARSNHDVDYIFPCTPSGIDSIFDYYGIDVSGKHCVVVGRSNIVGKPMAEMLINEDATVTVCHSHTKNLAKICKDADILICAIGKPKFFTKDYIKDGAIVIDVGMNRDENGKLCGDVDFDDVKDMDIMITPVPGGVGKVTVASLMVNCAVAYELQHKEVLVGDQDLLFGGSHERR